MSTDDWLSRQQATRVLEWLAAGGVAWLVGSRFERGLVDEDAADEDLFVESGASNGTPRVDVVCAGDVLLANDSVVAGLIAQSTRDARGVARHVRLGQGGYQVHTAYLGHGWTLGAFVPAELDAGQVGSRVERAATILRRALGAPLPPTPGAEGSGGPDDGPSGAPAHAAVRLPSPRSKGPC